MSPPCDRIITQLCRSRGIILQTPTQHSIRHVASANPTDSIQAPHPSIKPLIDLFVSLPADCDYAVRSISRSFVVCFRG
ncbi:hypothetical protein L2E82_51604 [Cichorium intybus]|nr:hypothetical protein L2E82_51604 [Cichorium intybus]